MLYWLVSYSALGNYLRRHYENTVHGIFSVRNETASRILRYARFIQRAVGQSPNAEILPFFLQRLSETSHETAKEIEIYLFPALSSCRGALYKTAEHRMCESSFYTSAVNAVDSIYEASPQQLLKAGK